MACRRRSLLLASLALILRRCRRRQEWNKKQKWRFWVGEVFTEERKERGESENLFRELSNVDWEYYYRYLCMRQDTNYRKSIPVKKQLVITLRYLAEGCSQQAFCHGFRVGKSTVSKILNEVCEALYTALATHYLRPTSTEEDWKQISPEFLELRNWLDQSMASM